MARVVTVTTSHPVVVISERYSDRERFENGRDIIQAGETQDFIVHSGQSVRIEVHEEPAAVNLQLELSEDELEAQGTSEGAKA